MVQLEWVALWTSTSNRFLLAMVRGRNSVWPPAQKGRRAKDQLGKIKKFKPMKKLLWVAPVLVAALVWAVSPGKAQEKTAPKYEYAVLKWDGPDRLYYNLPDKFEWVHLEKKG